MMDWVSAHAGLLGLLIFFGFFTVITIWTYRPGARQHYRDQAALMLRDDV